MSPFPYLIVTMSPVPHLLVTMCPVPNHIVTMSPGSPSYSHNVPHLIVTMCPQSDNTSPYLHDAVVLWATLAQEVKSLGQDLRDGSRLKERAKSRSFTGDGKSLLHRSSRLPRASTRLEVNQCPIALGKYRAQSDPVPDCPGQVEIVSEQTCEHFAISFVT